MLSPSNLYDYARLWFLIWAIVGFGVSAGATLSAHLDVLANRHSNTSGGALLYALTRRSGELLTVVAQFMLVIVGFIFISAPPPPLNTPAGEAGTFRVSFVAIAVMALTIKSAIVFVNGATIQRLIKDAARAIELETLNRSLDAATRAKSEFLANMSHELRTPLNAILGFSDLLQEQIASAITEKQMRYLQNIRDAGAYLLELINDVLDLSKVEAGHIDLRPDRISIGQLVDPVVTTARREADERHVHFGAAVTADARVRVDPGRMRQVLSNLVSNALKFTPANGEIALAVAIDGRDLLVSVRDTGIGIPVDRRERVFGMFERVNEDRSDAKGTGLGLALTKRLVELHGGQIDFESAIGVGTTFRVRLPGVVVAAVSGPHLLVVEDDARDADLIVELAAAAGLVAETVGTADAAIAALESEPLVGVVLDLRLPDKRGEHVLERLRGGGVRRVPLVVVSVEDDDGRSRQLGADDYFTKPIDRTRLRAWLDGVARGPAEGAIAPASG